MLIAILCAEITNRETIGEEQKLQSRAIQTIRIM